MSRGRSTVGSAGLSVLGGSGGESGVGAVGVRPEDEVKLLRKELDRRQAMYISREREYRTRIELLEQELTKSRGGKGGGGGGVGEVDAHRDKLHELHRSIVTSIESVQTQTSRLLEEQKQDMLRAFRSKLFKTQVELEHANARASEGAAEWVERAKQLQKELEWSKETADSLDRHNQMLDRENQRLRAQFKSQEDDREYLVRQLVAVKKDNARLRQDLSAAQEEVVLLRQEAEEAKEAAAGALAAGFASGGGGGGGGGEVGTPRLRSRGSVGVGGGGGGGRVNDEALRRMKRLLDSERRHLRLARQALAAEVQQRSEIEKCFRTALQEVQSDLAVRKARAMGTAVESKRGEVEPLDFVPVDELGPADRKEVLRRLLQQEQVLRLIRDSVFTTAERKSSAHRATITIAAEAGAARKPLSSTSSPSPSPSSAAPSPIAPKAGKPAKSTKGLVIRGTGRRGE